MPSLHRIFLDDQYGFVQLRIRLLYSGFLGLCFGLKTILRFGFGFGQGPEGTPTLIVTKIAKNCRLPPLTVYMHCPCMCHATLLIFLRTFFGISQILQMLIAFTSAICELIHFIVLQRASNWPACPSTALRRAINVSFQRRRKPAAAPFTALMR